MLHNFLKTAFRQFAKNKWYTSIHLVGLTLGLATSLVILLLIRFETTFDKHWDDVEQIHRISTRFSGSFESKNRGVPGPLPAAVRNEVPDFSDVAALHTRTGPVTLIDDPSTLFRNERLALVDTSFFKVFPNWEWLAGRGAVVLAEPATIVLSEKAAERYFGKSGPDIIGKEVIYHDSLHLTVAGVVGIPQNNTDIQFDAFVSFPTISASWLRDEVNLESWGGVTSSSLVFVRLAPGVTTARAQESLHQFEERSKEENDKWNMHFELHALSGMHFNTDYGRFDNSGFALSRSSLRSLAIVAFFLLALACFNFINLETAKATLRTKEIGVRKVLGGSKASLIRQLLGETAILTLVAGTASIPLAGSLLPSLKDYLPTNFTLVWSDPNTLFLLTSLILLVTFLSGLYPAWLVTSSAISSSIRASNLSAGNQRGSTRVRKLLIAGQFFVTQLLLIATLVVWRQTDFAINKDMGFSSEAIVHFHLPWRSSSVFYDQFEQRMRQHSEVQQLSRFAGLPAYNGWSTQVMQYEMKKEKEDISVHVKQGDTSYLSFFEFKFLAGRPYFKRDSTTEYVVNEKLANIMGYDNPGDAVGAFLHRGENQYPIVGVVENFHVQNLHEPIPAVALSYRRSNNLGVKMAASRWQDVDEFIGFAKQHWEEIWPAEEFNYGFMDETIAQLYRSEVRTAKLLTGGTTIAVLISFMGLLGLVGFLAHRRTKEIGIRKVLGATVSNVVGLLSWDFLKWILIAIVPSSLVGYWVMRNWLNEFAYSFNFNGILIGVAAMAILLIAGLAVVGQGLRAAQTNPAESLKVE